MTSANNNRIATKSKFPYSKFPYSKTISSFLNSIGYFDRSKCFTLLHISLLLFGLSLISINVSATTNHPIVTEINYQGSSHPQCQQCAFDKWIELYNPNPTPLSLDGYSLRFKNSQEPEQNLSLQGSSINPYSYFLVANKRSGMDSLLPYVGINPNVISGKVLSVSNNQTKSVNLTLLFNFEIVQTVELGPTFFDQLVSSSSDVRHSLEFINGRWIRSEYEYYAGNYGSPMGVIATNKPKPEEPLPPITLPLPVISTTSSVVQPTPQEIIPTNPIESPILEPLVENVIQHTPLPATSSQIVVTQHYASEVISPQLSLHSAQNNIIGPQQNLILTPYHYLPSTEQVFVPFESNLQHIRDTSSSLIDQPDALHKGEEVRPLQTSFDDYTICLLLLLVLFSFKKYKVLNRISAHQGLDIYSHVLPLIGFSEDCWIKI